MPDTGIVGANELVQINATMIAGILIFYTIPYITAGGPVWKKEHWSENVVLALIATAIGLFALPAIFAFTVVIPFYVSYLSTIGGFIAIAIAASIFIKVIKIAKEERRALGRVQIVEYGPLPAAEEEIKRVQEEEEELRKRGQKKAPIEESKSFVSMWPPPKEKSSDNSYVDYAVDD